MPVVLLALLAAAGVGVVVWALMPSAPAQVADEAAVPQGVMPSEVIGAARRSFQIREALATPMQGLASPLMRGRQNQLQTELQRADLQMRAAEFVLIQVGTALLLGLIAVLRFGHPLVGIAGLAGGYFLQPIYLPRQNSKPSPPLGPVLA